MNEYVLDASVAAKWILRQEPLATESVGLLDSFTAGEIHLTVPDLFWPELANMLWKSFRMRRLSDETAMEAIAWLTKLDFPTSPTKPFIAAALAIARRFNRTVDDAIYLALAVASNRPVLTADERLTSAVAGFFPVRWLGSGT